MTPEDVHRNLEHLARDQHRRRPDADVQVNAAELVELFDRLRGMELDQRPPCTVMQDLAGNRWIKTFRETWVRQHPDAHELTRGRRELSPSELLQEHGPLSVVLP